jgi:hypothetical protein
VTVLKVCLLVRESSNTRAKMKNRGSVREEKNLNKFDALTDGEGMADFVPWREKERDDKLRHYLLIL